MGYLKASYSHYCKRCGKDISDRVESAEYCHECSEFLNKQRTADRKKEFDILRLRDTYAEPKIICHATATRLNYKYRVCPVCDSILNYSDNFCRFCGKRVRSKDNMTERGMTVERE